MVEGKNMEDNPDEDGKVVIGKNVIHHNFENVEFLKNFRIFLKNNEYVHNTNEEYTNVPNLMEMLHFENKEDTKKYIQRNMVNREKHRKKKKCIIHLVPSKNSNFYSFLKKKKEEVLKKYGTDETYKYDVHISLTGYFFCDNINTFIKTLYIYMFCYVKLYFIYKKLSVSNLFFYISHKDERREEGNNRGGTNDEYNGDHFSRDEKEQLQERATYTQNGVLNILSEVRGREKVSVLNREEEEDKKNFSEQYVVMTNDGYVIIPILCEWVKRILENFRFLIKNNNFVSNHEYTTNVKKKLHIDTFSKNCINMNHVREKHNHNDVDRCPHCENIYSKLHHKGENNHDTHDLHASNERNIDYINVKRKKETVLLLPFPRTNLAGRGNITRDATQKSGALLVENNRPDESSTVCGGICMGNDVNTFKSEKNYYTDLSPSCKMASIDKKITEEGLSSHFKKTKKMKKRHYKDSYEKEDDKNRIRYTCNNMNVHLSEFRIKNCNHISLACNRNNQDVQKNIAYMYKDMKHHFSNCSWDLVMYEYNESSLPQEKSKNNFLNEIFRFRKFAVS
ncbi:conserved Plasmodium protein, unknown function [Plasmodium ovale wallikeri]|uniref:Uncharacterized protein n=1 Tax=Plasmodium ovale wallikeri TaxID=864142 RepID=A0A1A8YNJ8_PLAOA|nr:conserved Plasmodium protein, unknown function [Plasmodium ovale wallikeri]SBT33169.1 conserved Plasmodium protein, unknown function [Plasmodium ovale wallikeri]